MVGKRVRELRIKRGLSQQDLGLLKYQYVVMRMGLEFLI